MSPARGAVGAERGGCGDTGQLPGGRQSTEMSLACGEAECRACGEAECRGEPSLRAPLVDR